MPLTHLGRYRITATLGRGAMGIVYQAHDPLIERTVAIKTISFAGLTPEESGEFELRFFREAKSAGRLNHPNIVTIHDIGRSDDLAFIAMEFLSGRSLREMLDSGVVLAPERIAEIAAEIADGLAFAHANDVVHRDIKPANIMVLDNAAVKIADFGVALLPSASQTVAGTAFGSPKYMSPEQIAGQKADGRSDIFSLGALLYEMLTGHPPFSGDNLNAVLYQVLNSVPPLPSSCNPRLPASFDRIVARALAKDPDKRYQTAAEMAADLRNYRGAPGLMPQRKHVDSVPMAAAKPAAGNSTDVTLQITTVPPSASAPGSGSRALRYGIPLAALVLLAGGLLLRPSTPLPVANSRSTVLSPSATAPVVVEQKTEESKKTEQVPSAKPPVQAREPKAASDTTVVAKNRQSSSNWQTALRADLAACNQLAFFKQVICAEKARWKYCPGRWGSIEECTTEKK